MTASAQPTATIDGYISRFPDSTQVILQKIRRLIKDAVPDATEAVSYQIPAFKLNGKSLIYFAGWKDHVSMYPIPPGNKAFTDAIAPYVAGKGTLKFPFNKEIPYDLIQKVVALSVARNDQLYPSQK